MKTEIPEKFKEIEETVEQFSATALEIKEDYLDKLLKQFKDLVVKTSTTMKQLIEKMIEILKYLSHTDCSIYASGSTNSEEKTIKGEVYVKCRIKKQEILDTLLDLLKNNLKCTQIFEYITTEKIGDNLEENLKYVLLLINELSNNPESFKEKTSEILFELVDCITDNFDGYWKEVESYLEKSSIYLEDSIKAIKRDVENIILQTLENLAKLIDYEQLDGYIKEVTKTGLIVYDKAKKIQRKILDFSKKLIDFGNANYTFSGSMIANIETKEGMSVSSDTETKATFIQDKDIVILTHSNFLLNKDGAYALQTLVFESPIVSVKASAETEGSSDTVNTFISITLYDSDGKEISVENIIEKYRPEILYLKEKYNHLKACYYYNEDKNDLVTDGISSVEKVDYLGKEYFKCITSHLSSFTAGTYGSNTNKKKSKAGMVVLIIFSILLLIAIGVIVFFVIRKRKSNENNFDNNMNTKEGLVPI